MNHFTTPTDPGVWQTFVVMAAIYFVFMIDRRVRLPRAARRLEAGGLDPAARRPTR